PNTDSVAATCKPRVKASRIAATSIGGSLLHREMEAALGAMRIDRGRMPIDGVEAGRKLADTDREALGIPGFAMRLGVVDALAGRILDLDAAEARLERFAEGEGDGGGCRFHRALDRRYGALQMGMGQGRLAGERGQDRSGKNAAGEHRKTRAAPRNVGCHEEASFDGCAICVPGKPRARLWLHQAARGGARARAAKLLQRTESCGGAATSCWPSGAGSSSAGAVGARKAWTCWIERQSGQGGAGLPSLG